VGISGGVASQTGGAQRVRRYFDASGALVPLGGIDMHVLWIPELGHRS
jgi:hypothetical protein